MAGRLPPGDKLAYSVKEAAEALSIGVSTMYELIAQGALSSKKIGARRVIPRWALEELLETPEKAAETTEDRSAFRA